MIDKPRLDGVHVTVLPGVPGPQSAQPWASDCYPSTTPAVVKRMLASGATVDFAHPTRSVISINADEIWLPILAFTTTVISNGLGGMLADFFASKVMSRERSSTLHVDWRFTASDGTSRRLKFDGSPQDLEKALRALEFHFPESSTGQHDEEP